MQNFLNLTLPLKQDAASLAGAQKLAAALNIKDSPLKKQVEAALTDSKIVHFARFLVIGTQYIQVITTYDGNQHDYSVFFWNKLNSVFKAAYELVEGAPAGDDWNEDNFLAFNALPAHQPQPFFLYSAYPDKTVRKINGSAPAPAKPNPKPKKYRDWGVL